MSTLLHTILRICGKTGTKFRAVWSGRGKGCNFCAHWRVALARTHEYQCLKCKARYVRGVDDADC